MRVLIPHFSEAAKSILLPHDRMSVYRRFSLLSPGTHSHLGGVRKVGQMDSPPPKLFYPPLNASKMQNDSIRNKNASIPIVEHF
jgi:hypothetical protein